MGKQITTGSSIKAYHSFFFGKFLALIVVGNAAWKILEYLGGRGYKNSAIKS